MERTVNNETKYLYECIGKISIHETETPAHILKEIIKYDINPHTIHIKK